MLRAVASRSVAMDEVTHRATGREDLGWRLPDHLPVFQVGFDDRKEPGAGGAIYPQRRDGDGLDLAGGARTVLQLTGPDRLDVIDMADEADRPNGIILVRDRNAAKSSHVLENVPKLIF